MSCHQLVVSKPRQCLGFAFEIGAIWWCFGCLPLACKCQLGTWTPSGNFLKQSMATRGAASKHFVRQTIFAAHACTGSSCWLPFSQAWYGDPSGEEVCRGHSSAASWPNAECGRSAKGCLTVCLFFSIIFGYTGEYDTKIIAYTWAYSVTWL